MQEVVHPLVVAEASLTREVEGALAIYSFRLSNVNMQPVLKAFSYRGEVQYDAFWVCKAYN